jgi:hypothetical protein
VVLISDDIDVCPIVLVIISVLVVLDPYLVLKSDDGDDDSVDPTVGVVVIISEMVVAAVEAGNVCVVVNVGCVDEVVASCKVVWSRVVVFSVVKSDGIVDADVVIAEGDEVIAEDDVVVPSRRVLDVVTNVCDVDGRDVRVVSVLVTAEADVVLAGSDMVVDCPFVDSDVDAVLVKSVCEVDDVSVAMDVVRVEAGNEIVDVSVRVEEIGFDVEGDAVVIVPDVVELLSDAIDVELSVGAVVTSMPVVLDPYVVVEIFDGDAYCVDL